MIHYHGTPFSGVQDNQLALKGRHACISFANPSAVAICSEICQSYILDNGAFSAWRAGKPFDIGGFAAFIQTWHRDPGCDWYLMPDVIDGGADENSQIRGEWHNLVGSEIWSKGVPVWHLDEPLDVLRDFMNFPVGRVALGSSGDYAQIGTRQWWERMTEAMDILTDEMGRPVVKIHGLRMLDPEIFGHFPFASADSTNVAQNIGIDSAWRGTYTPASKYMRALVIMDRVESAPVARAWKGHDRPWLLRLSQGVLL